MMDIDFSYQYHTLCDYIYTDDVYEMSPDEDDQQIINMVIRQVHT